MKLLTYHKPTGLALGIRTPDGVLDVAAAAACYADAGVPATPAAFYAAGSAGLEPLAELLAWAGDDAELVRDPSRLVLGPCVPTPQKILMVGVNYRSHAEETGATLPSSPVLFSKFANALAGDGEPVPLPSAAQQYDYEVELAAVIGRRARHVTPERALEYVLGYCVANDFSARDLQFRTHQWLLGKTLDKFLPLGPDLVTADEILDPQALHLRCWVNGDLRQDATTADMVFGVAHLVAYASAVMTLEPGDVICTGTPDGVVLGRPQRDWLRAGDVVVCEIAGLGRLTNELVAESGEPIAEPGGRPDDERVY